MISIRQAENHDIEKSLVQKVKPLRYNGFTSLYRDFKIFFLVRGCSLTNIGEGGSVRESANRGSRRTATLDSADIKNAYSKSSPKRLASLLYAFPSYAVCAGKA